MHSKTLPQNTDSEPLPMGNCIFYLAPRLKEFEVWRKVQAVESGQK